MLEGMDAISNMWASKWEEMKAAPLDTLNSIMKHPLFRFIAAGGNPIAMGVSGMGNYAIEHASMSSSDALPFSSTTSHHSTSSSRSTHVETVNIQTQATDAQSIAHDIRTGLQDELDQFDGAYS